MRLDGRHLIALAAASLPTASHDQRTKTNPNTKQASAADVAAAAAAGAAASPLSATPVFVYAARYLSGLPFEGPATVVLKEYQAASVAVAANEALALQRLLGPPPERKWAAAVADAAPWPPVVQLLGWLEAPPSDAAYEITGDNADGAHERLCLLCARFCSRCQTSQCVASNTRQHVCAHHAAPLNTTHTHTNTLHKYYYTLHHTATWLAYKFEGLRPLSLALPRLEPPQAPQGLQSLLFGGRAAAAAAASAARVALLRAFAARLLGALSFAHARGVAHCSLGAGSVQCGNFEDKSADRLIVKIDNWGLARMYPGPLEDPPEEEEDWEEEEGKGKRGGAWGKQRGGAATATGGGGFAVGGGAPGARPPLSAAEVLADADSDAAQQRRADLQAAALLLAEAFAAGAAGGDAAAVALNGGGEALRRMVYDIFGGDAQEFRAYCAADVRVPCVFARRPLLLLSSAGTNSHACTHSSTQHSTTQRNIHTTHPSPNKPPPQESLAPFVEFADATRAWELLGALMAGDTPAGELLRTSPFFTEAPAEAAEA